MKSSLNRCSSPFCLPISTFVLKTGRKHSHLGLDSVGSLVAYHLCHRQLSKYRDLRARTTTCSGLPTTLRANHYVIIPSDRRQEHAKARATIAARKAVPVHLKLSVRGSLERLSRAMTCHRLPRRAECGDSRGEALLYLHGLGHYHPETILDNHFLASLDIGVDVQWILDRVGIVERRTTLPLDYLRQTKNRDPREAAAAALITPVEMSCRATQMALQRAGLEASQIGLVVAGGCSPEMQIPADSSRVANALGIRVPCFDLQSACSSFASQIHFLNQMREEALPEFALVLNSETFTRAIDYSDRRQAVLFGDAASAAIVSTRVPSPNTIQETSFGTDPAGQHQIVIPTGGHFAQEGRAVQMFAIKMTTEIVRGLQASVPEGEARRQVFIGHQANLRMLENVCKRTNVALTDHYSNVAMFGNCGASGAPTVLSQHWDELRGTIVHMAVVGSGLAWGGMRIELGA